MLSDETEQMRVLRTPAREWSGYASRPTVVTASVALLGLQVVPGALLLLYALVYIFFNPKDEFGGGIILAAAIVLTVIALPGAIAGLAAARAKSWGYWSAIGIHTIYGALGVPTGLFAVLDSPGYGPGMMAFAALWLVLASLNASAALALLRRSARAWFGLPPLRWVR